MSKGLCTFWLDGRCFGISVTDVQEVVQYQRLTRVPLSRPEVSGLLNLRGQILTAVDLRRRMELPDRPEGQDPMNIVIRTDDGAVSLLVDKIGDVVEVEPGSFESPPDTLTGVARDFITGAYKLDGFLLLELDTRCVLAGLASSQI